MDITKERIQKILAAGANVVLTTQGVDDLCMKYFVDAGAMAVRRCKKGDLQVWPLIAMFPLASTPTCSTNSQPFDVCNAGRVQSFLVT